MHAIIMLQQKISRDRLRDGSLHVEIEPDPDSQLYIPASRIDELSEPFGNSVNQTRSNP